MAIPEKPQIDSVGRELRISWENLEDSPIHFSNSFLVQHNPNEFIISFAFIQPPNTLGLSPDEIDAMRAVTAHVQARIVLSPGRMKELSDILKKSYEKYLAIVAEGKDSSQ